MTGVSTPDRADIARPAESGFGMCVLVEDLVRRITAFTRYLTPPALLDVFRLTDPLEESA